MFVDKCFNSAICPAYSKRKATKTSIYPVEMPKLFSFKELQAQAGSQVIWDIDYRNKG
jgi:hypothetical protein